MKIIKRNTEVISLSLPKETAAKLELAREERGQSRSAFIVSLLERETEEIRWQKIYKKGQETTARLKITSEDDIDRIIHGG